MSGAGFGHHNTPNQETNSQHTWRKKVAAICTKNSPHNKNTRHTQERSHVKTTPKDHSR